MKRLGILILVLMVGGCEQLMQPVNNEPNAPLVIDPIIQTTEGLGAVLSPLWPPVGMVLTAVGGLFAGYKRLQPKLKEAQSEQEKYFAGGQILAGVLEDIKVNQPELWKVIGPKISEATTTTNEIGAAIDGFRGKT